MVGWGAILAALSLIRRRSSSQLVPAQETDPAPHFEPLLALLQAVVVTRDYANPAIDLQAGASTVAARDAGFAPEVVVAYLRQRVHETTLSAVGDWYRTVLVERLVARAIDAYFETSAADPTGQRSGPDLSPSTSRGATKYVVAPPARPTSV
jgi:hypothetical protein